MGLDALRCMAPLWSTRTGKGLLTLLHFGRRRSVEMYGTTLVYKNWQGSPHITAFRKKESDLECVKAVTVNGLPVAHVLHGGYLHFEAMVPPNENADLRVVYSSGQDLAASEDSIKYRAKAVLRRYLSEFRDNYLSRNAHLKQGALRIREALKL